ncbi:MAG: hypothetical protein C5B54_00830 [Acidobacteria bacterium]|nr:MAG: hypothetical protein C5B54_00830 [Acidobacteriota bacterium]
MKTERMKAIKHLLAVLSGYSFLFVIFFSPVIFSGQLLAPADAVRYHVPNFVHRTLWDPLLEGGFPVFADSQTMTWYPIQLFFQLLNSWNGFEISAYVLGSCFCYGYVYCLTNSRFASALAGVVFGMSGFFMSHLGHTAIIHSAIWMPLLFWSLEELARSFRYSWFVIGVGAVSFSLLAGHPQVPMNTFPIAGAYTLMRGFALQQGRLKYFTHCLLIIILGFGLAGIQLIPTFELSQLSTRAEASFEYFSSYSIAPGELYRFFFPFLFGGTFGSIYSNIPYFGTWNYGELTGYTGLAPLLLSIIAVITGRRNRVVLFWAIICAYSLILSLGSSTPLVGILYHVPVYNKFRAIARHLFEFELSIAVLSGVGVLAIRNGQCSRRTLFKVLAGGVAFFVALVLSLNIFPPEAVRKNVTSLLPWSDSAVGIPVVLFVVSVISVYIWSRQSSNRIGQSVVLLVVIIDLASFGWFSYWRYISPLKSVLVLPPVYQDYKNVLEKTRQRIVSAGGGFDIEEACAPNLSKLWNLPSVGGYLPFMLSRVGAVLTMDPSGMINEDWLSSDNRALDLFSARYLFISEVSNVMNLDAPGTVKKILANPRWKFLQQIGKVYVFENRQCMPRVWIVFDVRSGMGPRRMRRTIKSSSLPNGAPFDPEKIALIEESTPLKFFPDSNASARISQYASTEVVVETNSNTPGFLVLNDVYYPGWIVHVDGNESHLFCTDAVFRGVIIPAGKHLVHFSYTPKSLYAGIVLSLLSLLITLSLPLISKDRKRIKPPAQL